MTKLCRECKHCKTVRVGMVSSRSWCSKAGGSGYYGSGLGVNISSNKPHPKCPLKEK